MWLWAAKGDDTAAKDYQAAVILLHSAHNLTIRLLQSSSASTAQTSERRKSERVSRGTGFLQMDRVIDAASRSWPCGAQRAVIHPLAASYFPTIPTQALAALDCFAQASSPTSISGCEELPTLVPRLSCDGHRWLAARQRSRCKHL